VSRSLFLGLVTYIFLLAGIVSLRGEYIALALPLVVYLLSGFLFAPEEINLKATRHVSAERTSPNTDVTVTVTLTNLGAHLEEVLIEDMLPADLYLRDSISSNEARLESTRHLIRLPKDSSFTFSYRVAGPRGAYGFESVKVRANDHLAVISREVQTEAKGQLFILPPAKPLQHIAIRPRRTRVFAGSIPARVGGIGTEFFGVREYHPGDPPRAINWRASAHHEDMLYSNEFQQERAADVGIILDGRLRTNQFPRGHSLFEHSVHAAAALADTLLTQGNRVGLLAFTAFLRWTLPGYGKIQREKIMFALAHARPGDSDVFGNLEHLPTRLFAPESQIILVSPFHSDDLIPLIQLRARGYQVLVISPDPVKFELSYLPKDKRMELAGRIAQMERNLTIQKARHAGIQVLDWDVSKPLDETVKQRLGRPIVWARVMGS
jgi:uncharacterized protein (DUF58 family)